MNNPKSREYKRIYNVLWAFYIFFILVISSVVYISIDEMNKISTISDNYKVMNSVYYLTDDILANRDSLDLMAAKADMIDEQLAKLNLVYYSENTEILEKLQKKNDELKSILQPPFDAMTDSSIVELTQSIRWDSRDFIENKYLQGNDSTGMTKKMVIILTVLTLIVLTLIFMLVLLPTIKKLDKLAIQLAQSNGIKEKSIQKLAARTEEIDLRERRFRTIAELSPIGLFLTDADGNCQFVNQRYSDIVGLSFKESLGDGWKNAIYEEDRNKIFDTWFDSVKNNEENYINEYRVIKDGIFKYIAVKAKPIKNDNNEISSFVGMIEDITTARESRDNLVSAAIKFESIIDDLPYGAVIVNEDGFYFNKVVEELTGYTNEEIDTLDKWFVILHNDDSGEIREEYEESKKEGFQKKIILNLVTKSGVDKKVEFQGKISDIGVVWGLVDRTKLIEATTENKLINEEYKFILDSIKIGVWDWDLVTNDLSWNEIMYSIIGVESGTLITKYDDYKQMIHPEDASRVEQEINHVLITPDEEFKTVFRIILKNEEIRYIKAASKTHRDENGRAIRMAGLNWDVTSEIKSESDRKELAEKYDFILNSTNIGVWDWDFRVNKLSWNETMYKLFEVDEDSETIYEDYQTKLHPKDSSKMGENLEKILSGEWEEYESEFRIILSDYSIKYIKAITKIEKDKEGKVFRIYGINIDITELKENALNLTEAKEKADTANRAKSTFLANMSHEIRTPMNAILGFGEILSTNNTDAKNQNYISGIIKSGNSLLALINDVLDFSKIEANKMHLNLNSVDIKRSINDIDRIFELTISKKGLQYYSNINDKIPSYLILDEGKLKQILINLLGNAVKFTHEGEVKLDVNFKLHELDTSKITLVITVEDSGIGINPNKIDRIFEAFEQEDNNDSRKYEGTGLGLSIVKSIVELQNGTISVDSELGKGSKFTVEIPEVSISLMRSEEINNLAKEGFIKANLTGKTLLFAEDIESNRNVVKGFLEDSNLRLLFANNGEEAIEVARNNKVDLAFIDLHMPIMDGMTMAKIWSNDEKLKSIPLVALTAEIYNQEKQQNNNFFREYLTKPVRAEEIYKTILVQTGLLIEDKSAHPTEEIFDMNFNEDTIIKLKENNFGSLALMLQNKLNTRELGKLIEKIEFLAEMENDNSLRNYTNELKLALDTFNVNDIKKLLQKLTT